MWHFSVETITTERCTFSIVTPIMIFQTQSMVEVTSMIAGYVSNTFLHETIETIEKNTMFSSSDAVLCVSERCDAGNVNTPRTSYKFRLLVHNTFEGCYPVLLGVQDSHWVGRWRVCLQLKGSTGKHITNAKCFFSSSKPTFFPYRKCLWIAPHAYFGWEGWNTFLFVFEIGMSITFIIMEHQVRKILFDTSSPHLHQLLFAPGCTGPVTIKKIQPQHYMLNPPSTSAVLWHLTDASEWFYLHPLLCC